MPLLQTLLVWFIPESPRFLVSKGMVSCHASTVELGTNTGGLRRVKHLRFYLNTMPTKMVLGIHLSFSRSLRSGMLCGWKRNSTRVHHIYLYSSPRAIGRGCELSLPLPCFRSGGKLPLKSVHLTKPTYPLISGNGLVSYYINLVLEGVGVTKTETKAVINGGLQVCQSIRGLHSALFLAADL